MRKKYLSALLFGALLFASAGTFTSCKDYDDDINNLSQRIDQVASDLNDLKTKVDALGGYVENVSFADGVLSVTTGGKTVTYNIPDKTGANNVTLALEGNNLKVTVDGHESTVALPESATQEMPEIKVEDGVLYVGDKEYPLTVDVDNNVQIIDDNIPGNETIGVEINGEKVAFPKAFADVRISLAQDGDFLFTEYKDGKPAGAIDQEDGIHWAFASKDYTWADGVKDAPKSGELVVGQITAAKVSVRPVSYDLKAHQDELTLVSSTGQTARAKVLVYESGDNGPIESTGSRAASTNVDELTHGDYVIAIELDPTLTAEEIIKAFANADNTANLKYALALNGTVVTDYQFVIDTQLKADTQATCADPIGNYFVIGGKAINEAPLGTHQMAYLDGRIYDMKVTIDPSSEDDAEVYGVSINPKTNEITASDAAAERTFKLNITLIDVNGNVSKTETVEVTFEKADVAPVTKLEPTVVTVTPRKDKSFVINLQDALSSLDASDAIYIKDKLNIEWGIEPRDKGFFMNSINSKDVTYFEDAECKKEVDLSDGVTSEKLRKIKYAKIKNDNYDGTSGSELTLGEHLLTLTLKKYRTIGGNDKIVFRTINVPVDVKEPTWEDLFEQADNNWANDVFTTRISWFYKSTGKAAISLDAYKVKDDKNGATKDGIEVVYVGANIDGNEVNVINDRLATEPEDNEPLNVLDGKTITKHIVLDTDASVATADGELKVSDVTVNYQYIIYKSDGTPAFVIEKKDVKVAIKSMYADLKLVWLDKDGNETAGPAVLNADNTINGTGSAKSSKKNGLAFAFYKQYVEAGDADAAQYNTFSVEGIAGYSQKLTESSNNLATPPSDQGIVYFVWDASNENGGTVTVDASAAHTGKADGTYDKASYIHLLPTTNALEKGTIKVTFMDVMGVKHTSEVSFEK